MTPEQLKQFQILRNQFGVDLVGRIVYELSLIEKGNNEELKGISDQIKFASENTELHEQEERIDQKNLMLALDGIQKAIESKTIDFSGVNTGDQDFLTLPDTPNTYVGQALKTVRVNAGATGLEFAVGGGGGGTVDTIVEGVNISVDATDPANPIVSAFIGNIDGGVASSLFLPSQVINGGAA